MRVIPTVQRPLVLLASVVLAQVLLLAVQIKREGNVSLIRVWGVRIITPVQRSADWAIGSVRDTWNNYVSLRQTRQENHQLRTELAQLKLRVNQLESQAAEAKRLSALIGFREANAEVPMLAARVVSASASEAVHTVYIDRGETDGVRKNMAVITPDGVVGKILAVYPGTAQVLLITDKESGVGVLLANSRAHGVVRGTGEPNVELNFVINDQEVAIGETVLTSGLDQIYPKDLPVGTVFSAQAGSPFKQIRLKTAARLDRLEEVIVLLSQQPLPGGQEAETRSANPAPGKTTPN